MKQRYKAYIFYFPEQKKLYLTDSWEDAMEKRKGIERKYKGVNTREDVLDWVEKNIKANDVHTIVSVKGGVEKCLIR